jgi:hypothetical protein
VIALDGQPLSLPALGPGTGSSPGRMPRHPRPIARRTGDGQEEV